MADIDLIDLTDQLQHLRQMIDAVRLSLGRADTEAARLLVEIAERLVTLSELAEATADPEDDPADPLPDDVSRP